MNRPSTIQTDDKVLHVLSGSLGPLVRAVGCALGPDGRGVLVGRGGGAPAVLWKGSSIAREIPAAHGALGVAPRILKETLLAFDREHSDGTARLAVMAGTCLKALVREAAAGAPVQQLADSILHLAMATGGRLAADWQTAPELIQVARAGGVPDELAEALAALVHELGSEACFDIKDGGSETFHVTKTEGFALDAKPVGSKALPSLASASVLVADEIIDDFGAIAPVLEGFATKRKALVIAARGITGTALATLQANQAKSLVTVSALVPAEAGPHAAECLEDLAIATGATLVADRLGTQIGKVKPTMLGRTREFRFDQDRATFIGPDGRPEEVAMRRRFLAAQAAKAKNLSLDRERFERRRARLGGVWCELRVSRSTPQETALLIECAKAAVANLQSVMRHGAVPGGGEAYAGLLSGIGVGGTEVRAARRPRPRSNPDLGAAADCCKWRRARPCIERAGPAGVIDSRSGSFDWVRGGPDPQRRARRPLRPIGKLEISYIISQNAGR